MQSICWHCKNAVPHIVKGIEKGCEWSLYKQKVPGWTAKEYTMKFGSKELPSFVVLKCPKYAKG